MCHWLRKDWGINQTWGPQEMDASDRSFILKISKNGKNLLVPGIHTWQTSVWCWELCRFVLQLATAEFAQDVQGAFRVNGRHKTQQKCSVSDVRGLILISKMKLPPICHQRFTGFHSMSRSTNWFLDGSRFWTEIRETESRHERRGCKFETQILAALLPKNQVLTRKLSHESD